MFPSTPPPTSAHLFLPLSSLGPTGGLPDMPPPLSSSVCAPPLIQGVQGSEFTLHRFPSSPGGKALRDIFPSSLDLVP